MIRIGIAGTGFIAPFHCEGLNAQEGVRVTGVCGRTLHDHVRGLAEEWGAKAYRDFDEMVEDPAIDALVIASVNTLHREQVLKAISLKKPVMVEKPISTDAAELAEIADAAGKSGILVFPAHNFVYRPAVREAKRIIDSGQLGRIVHASFVSTHTISSGHETGWRSRLTESGGGALMDSGHHQVYQSVFFLGKAVRVHAFRSRFRLTGMEGEDLAQVNLSYADGSMGHVLQSWASGHGTGISGIRILGEEGSLVIDDGLMFNGQRIELASDFRTSFFSQAEAFVKCMRGRAEPLSDLGHARDTLATIHAAYQSADRGIVVSL